MKAVDKKICGVEGENVAYFGSEGSILEPTALNMSLDQVTLQRWMMLIYLPRICKQPFEDYQLKGGFKMLQEATI